LEAKTLRDPVDEALRLLEEAGRRGLTVRLLGGVAVHLVAPNTYAGLERDYEDIDLATDVRGGTVLDGFMTEIGYEPNTAFNTYNGNVRLLYYDRRHGRQVDVFVGDFRMCHTIPLRNRLDIEPRTIPRAELLLTKIQIVELNRKDVQDIYHLFLDNPVTEDDQGINAPQVSGLCAADWGLYRTFTLNMEKILALLADYPLQPSQKERIAVRMRTLLDRVRREPKKLKWKLRAAVGDRVPWYEIPEEVQR
jgi:hypothetical protein